MKRLLLAVCVLVGCGGSDDDTTSDTGVVDGGSSDATDDTSSTADAAEQDWPRTIDEERPAKIVVPDQYDGTQALPLLFFLHGYSGTAAVEDLYLHISDAAYDLGFFLVLPDGTVDSHSRRFWNATPGCCNFDDSDVDDVAYLRRLITEMKETFMIDDTRVYFFGHSNGGFMSYRMACDAADEVTAVASLAGSTFLDEEDCNASQPVSVLQIHGTLDEEIPIEGNAFFPGAEETVQRWATRAGCDTDSPTTGEPLDLLSDIDGSETSVKRYETGCAEGNLDELWTIEGGDHIPPFDRTFMIQVGEWLLARHR